MSFFCYWKPTEVLYVYPHFLSRFLSLFTLIIITCIGGIVCLNPDLVVQNHSCSEISWWYNASNENIWFKCTVASKIDSDSAHTVSLACDKGKTRHAIYWGNIFLSWSGPKPFVQSVFLTDICHSPFAPQACSYWVSFLTTLLLLHPLLLHDSAGVWLLWL